MPRVVDRPRKYRCSFEACKRRFGSESDRQRHERIHTGIKPFVCDVCNKGFPQFTGLKTHQNTHTGLKPHHCMFCDQAFADPSSKARHEKETHRCLGTYKCPAPDCPVGIKRRSAFVVHLREKHGLDKDMVDIDACAPKILPKVSRKARAEKAASLLSEASSKVTEKPHRLTRSTGSQMVIPTAPPMVQSISHMQDVAGGKSSKLDGEANENQRYEDKVRLARQEADIAHWDLSGINHIFGYGDHELMYPPPPSYTVATSIDPSHPSQFPYTVDFPPLHAGPFLHLTTRTATSHFDFSSSSELSPNAPRVSTLGDGRFTPRLAVTSVAHLGPISMPNSRSATPIVPTLPEFSEAYYHHSGKGTYNFYAYEPATGVQGIHG